MNTRCKLVYQPCPIHLDPKVASLQNKLFCMNTCLRDTQLLMVRLLRTSLLKNILNWKCTVRQLLPQDLATHWIDIVLLLSVGLGKVYNNFGGVNHTPKYKSLLEKMPYPRKIFESNEKEGEVPSPHPT